MNEAEVKAIAKTIADEMIACARFSGDEPVVFVTGNSLFPPLRHYNLQGAERVWQYDVGQQIAKPDEDGLQPSITDWYGFLVKEVERLLEEADVTMDEGLDGSLYVVDETRFEFIDEHDTAETLQAQYRMYNSGMQA